VKAAATYVCVDCGYILEEPLDKLPNSYKCPVCQAPKRRFKPWSGSGRNDAKSMAARMKTLKSGGGEASSSGGGGSSGAIAVVAGGAVLLGALYFYLSSQYN
jgi:rubredoxin